MDAKALREADGVQEHRSEDRPADRTIADHKPGTGKYADFCPSLWGGKDWPSAAYNPKTGMIYIPANDNHCGHLEGKKEETWPASWWTGVSIPRHRLHGRPERALVRRNPGLGRQATGKRAWTHQVQRHDELGPDPDRGGGWLVFDGGTNDRMFRAFDAKTGEGAVALQDQLRGRGSAVSFAVDGIQYIAVQSGWASTRNAFRTRSRPRITWASRTTCRKAAWLGIRRQEVTAEQISADRATSRGPKARCFRLNDLPLVSTFAFSSSFICLMVGSRLASPVVCVVVAGGLLLEIDVRSGGVFAGRVAVAPGAVLVWAFANGASKSRTPDSRLAASVPNFTHLCLSTWLRQIDENG